MKRQPLKIKNAAFRNENPIKVSTRQSQPHCTGSLLVILMPINKIPINRNAEKKETSMRKLIPPFGSLINTFPFAIVIRREQLKRII